MNNENVTLKFEKNLVKKLNVSTATASEAVAEAAMSAVAQDSRVTVRTFSDALRSVAPMLGTSTQVLSAAIKAAKEKDATLDAVCQSMADAAAKKRADDARRAADRRNAQPAKDLAKAQSKVNECLLALRSPLQKAIDDVTASEERVKAASKLLREARADLRKARAKVEAMTRPAEPTDTKPTTEAAA